MQRMHTAFLSLIRSSGGFQKALQFSAKTRVLSGHLQKTFWGSERPCAVSPGSEHFQDATGTHLQSHPGGPSEGFSTDLICENWYPRAQGVQKYILHSYQALLYQACQNIWP